jgi:hypothetical protein
MNFLAVSTSTKTPEWTSVPARQRAETDRNRAPSRPCAADDESPQGNLRMTDSKPVTVAEAMVTTPKVHKGTTTVADLREFFKDDHVHAALIVNGRRLVSVVERNDLTGRLPNTPSASLGRLADRAVISSHDLNQAYRKMVRERRRRLAVIGPTGDLIGLLCLKQSQSGFCSDTDVAARAAERVTEGVCAAARPERSRGVT